jgi:hypothetical protein
MISFVQSYAKRALRVPKAEKMLCAPWPRCPLTSSRLSASATGGLGENFSLGTLKNIIQNNTYYIIEENSTSAISIQNTKP